MGNLISSQFLVPLGVTLIFNFCYPSGISFCRYKQIYSDSLCLNPEVLVCGMWYFMWSVYVSLLLLAPHPCGETFFTLLLGPYCKACIGQASIYVKCFPPHFCLLICKPGVLVVPANRVVGRTKSINICKVF